MPAKDTDTTAPQSRKTPGLPAIYKARAERQRGKWTRLTPAGYGWLILGVGASLLAYRYFAGNSLEEARSKLLAKQRAAETELGPRWYPMRDKLEAATLGAAKAYDGDLVTADGKHSDFREQPGLYLRLRVADAADSASLRKAASESSKDGFTGCLLKATAPATVDGGAAAASTRNGEADAGAPRSAAWNLRQAYAATRILTPEWVSEVKDAGDDLRLRVFQDQYDKDVERELPLAFDIVTRAKYFLLVLDEDVPEARDRVDGGAVTEEALQLVAHPARVHLFDLKTGQELFRVRRDASASFVFAGEATTKDPETLDAMQRQVNNCALARALNTALL